MSAVEEVEWGECLVAPVRDAALERDARKAFGVPYDAVRYFAKCPWLARAFTEGNLRNGIEFAKACKKFLRHCRE